MLLTIGEFMRRFQCALLAAVAVIGFASVASAAEMPVKAPVYKAPVAEPYWTGFYVGGNIGYSWGHVDSTATLPSFVDLGVGPASVVPGTAISYRNTPQGVIGGGQIGYDFQVGRWVYGLAVDFQGSGQKDSVNSSSPFEVIFGTADVTGTRTVTQDTKLNWFGTVRGRIGSVWDGLLLYATGGLAYGNVSISGTAANSANATPIGCAGPCPGFANATAFSGSTSKVGWTLGTGIEGVLANNWTWSVEYLYFDLGTANFLFNNAGFGPIAVSSRVTDNIVRVGLNYRFH